MHLLHKNSSAFKFLVRMWSKHCQLEERHIYWAKKNVSVSRGLKRGDILYAEGDLTGTIFLVTRGALGKTSVDDNAKRLIISVALAGMCLMTTRHLYSRTPSRGDIEVLHADTEVLVFSYASLFKFRNEERNVDTLINMMANKEKRQRDSLLIINRKKNPFKRCLLLAEELPEVFHTLFQNEISQLLDISRSTVQSVCRYLARKK